jgi:hypothetical protein
VVEVREVGRVYAVTTFFNVSGSQEDDLSEIAYNSARLERSCHSNVMN